jgi:hypothetical protein
MKLAAAFLLAAALLLVSLFNPAFAQPTQASYVVNLNSFSLQVTYPSEVMPGDNVTLNVQGSPKSNGLYLQTLTATVYYADAAGLHQLGTQTLVSNPANGCYYGSCATGSFNESFTVNVPQNATRTSLVAVFSETVQSNNYYSYDYWPYFGYPYHHHRHLMFLVYYPSYSITSDDAIAPLSYIKATTPEYVALQSEYQMLQQQLNQTQTQNKQLQTTISQLNQQLTSANGAAQTYQMVAVVFAIVAVASAAFNIYQLRSKRKTQKKSETKASKSE